MEAQGAVLLGLVIGIASGLSQGGQREEGEGEERVFHDGVRMRGMGVIFNNLGRFGRLLSDSRGALLPDFEGWGEGLGMTLRLL